MISFKVQVGMTRITNMRRQPSSVLASSSTSSHRDFFKLQRLARALSEPYSAVCSRPKCRVQVGGDSYHEHEATAKLCARFVSTSSQHGPFELKRSACFIRALFCRFLKLKCRVQVGGDPYHEHEATAKLCARFVSTSSHRDFFKLQRLACPI